MNLKSRLISILTVIFVLTEFINWLAVEGPIDSAFHLSFLEFLQPLIIFVVSLVPALLISVSPTGARKGLFIFVQTFIIVVEVYVLLWTLFNASSLFVQIVDRFASIMFGLIFLLRFYMIYLVSKIPEAKEA